MSKILRFSFIALLLLAMSAVAFGQGTTTGAIGGVVNNPNKEVVPGASVTVKNAGTGKEDTAVTDDQGRFKIGNLDPGTYTVTINASGFSAYNQEKIIVEVGTTTPINADLSIGPVSGVVEVPSEAPVINTQEQNFANNVNQTQINNLPINGSPTPRISFTASIAWRTPMMPGNTPRTPPSAQLGTMPGGGGSGNMQR